MGFPGVIKSHRVYNLLPYLADWAHHRQPGMDDGFKRGEFIASSQAAQCALLVQHLEKLGGDRGWGWWPMGWLNANS